MLKSHPLKLWWPGDGLWHCYIHISHVVHQAHFSKAEILDMARYAHTRWQTATSPRQSQRHSCLPWVLIVRRYPQKVHVGVSKIPCLSILSTGNVDIPWISHSIIPMSHLKNHHFWWWTPQLECPQLPSLRPMHICCEYAGIALEVGAAGPRKSACIGS